MDTAAHWIRTIRRQSEWKVQLVHFAQSPHLWCVSLAAICQLGYDVSAQLSDDGSGAYVSADITRQLSCSSSQLQHVSSAAFYSSDDNLSAVFGRPISWLQSIRFGCNVWVFRFSSAITICASEIPRLCAHLFSQIWLVAAIHLPSMQASYQQHHLCVLTCS